MLLTQPDIRIKEKILYNTNNFNFKNNLIPSFLPKQGCWNLKYLKLEFDNYKRPSIAHCIRIKDKVYLSKRYTVKKNSNLNASFFRLDNNIYFLNKKNLLKNFPKETSINKEELYEMYFFLDDIEKFLYDEFFF